MSVPVIRLDICGYFVGALVRPVQNAGPRWYSHPQLGAMGRVVGPGRVLPSGEQRIRCQFPSGDLDDCPLHELELMVDEWPAMCHLSRWLVIKLGGDPGNTAPPWFYDSSYRCWVLHSMNVTYTFHNTPHVILPGWRRPTASPLPGVTGETSPEQALVAACLSVNKELSCP